MRKLARLISCILFSGMFSWCGKLKAQNLRIRNYAVGYRVFEYSSVGGNPVSIAPQLKNRHKYEQYLQTIPYNSLSGDGNAIHNLHTFYLNAEFTKPGSSSSFWNRNSIQLGLLMTRKVEESGGSIGNQQYNPADTSIRDDVYTLHKKQRFFGINAGINRRFRIAKRLKFLVGLHAQGSVALIYHVEQRLDSSLYRPRTGRITKTTLLPDLKGNKFFQWQFMVPLGLEYEVLKQQLFVRIEADAGLIGSRYRPRSFADRECHGAGLWLLYSPHR